MQAAPDLNLLRSAIAELASERDALALQRRQLLPEIAGDPASASKVRKITDKLNAVVADLKTLEDALDIEEVKESDALRRLRVLQSQAVREQAARGALRLVELGAQADADANRLIETLANLREAGRRLGDDFILALSQLLPDAQTSAAMMVAYPRAAAAGPEVSAAVGGIVSRIVASTAADLTPHLAINRFGPQMNVSLEWAMREGAEVVASRLDLNLSTLKAN